MAATRAAPQRLWRSSAGARRRRSQEARSGARVSGYLQFPSARVLQEAGLSRLWRVAGFPEGTSTLFYDEGFGLIFGRRRLGFAGGGGHKIAEEFLDLHCVSVRENWK